MWIAAAALSSLALVVSALRAVISTNLVHSVFWLAAMLLSVAAVFFLLEASFIGVMQILLYTGGVITLMLFGIMLTHRVEGTVVPNPSHHRAFGAGASLFLLSQLLWAIWSTPLSATLVPLGTTAEVGVAFLTDQLLAFEALSVLLLGVMIGAIVLTRSKDP